MTIKLGLYIANVMASPRFDPQIYLDTFKDVKNWWQQGKQRGEAGGKGLYYQQHGRDTSGWEKNWVKNMNKKYGTNKTDMGQFTRDQYLKEHYDRYGKKEGRLKTQAYVRNCVQQLHQSRLLIRTITLTLIVLIVSSVSWRHLRVVR